MTTTVVPGFLLLNQNPEHSPPFPPTCLLQLVLSAQPASPAFLKLYSARQCHGSCLVSTLDPPLLKLAKCPPPPFPSLSTGGYGPLRRMKHNGRKLTLQIPHKQCGLSLQNRLQLQTHCLVWINLWRPSRSGHAERRQTGDKRRKKCHQLNIGQPIANPLGNPTTGSCIQCKFNERLGTNPLQ